MEWGVRYSAKNATWSKELERCIGSFYDKKINENPKCRMYKTIMRSTILYNKGLASKEEEKEKKIECKSNVH